MASEFELINSCFLPLSKGLQANELGIGDDGAVLNVPANHQLVVVTDTLVSGVHFPEETNAYDIAWKALAVNLSDLAAMGAEPGFFSLALTLPNNEQAWLGEFARGLTAISEQYSIPLIGGDTTKGHLTVTVTAQGWVEQGKAVRRSGAQCDDLICVTNTIGDGALGLKVAQNSLPRQVDNALSAEEKSFLLAALNRPIPQLLLSRLLSDYANSAIDISDGLLADMGHIFEQSTPGLNAEIELGQIPLSSATQKYIDKTQDWTTILTGGDDYQLCFTMLEDDFKTMHEKASKIGVELTVIGRVIESVSPVLLQDGEVFNQQGGELKGYLHF
ncbi:thiamine-monophosphate kinase [Thiomicrorhabdus immobilis]|uniref:Thiamine-monophosphate kinase n=1 Tax=Thiomicrorhabdus immobilis TaxID=2791037 RepID=A0ABN6CY50_9GAMM|nr:thiamine-phosphate kinase [Thiomicrorhabdus immobilis]BCN93614.1 thiamine-monophosphate kinase [Thiomicrorhabdus immobilis]